MLETDISLNKSNLENTLLQKGVDEYSLFKYYCPEFKTINKPFSLRKENKPSTRIIYKNGKLLITDFGDTEIQGVDVYNYVRIINNFPNNYKGYIRALEVIKNDFNINSKDIKNSGYNAKIITKKEDKKDIVIRYKSREYFSFNIDYIFWCKKYNIEKEEILPLFSLYNVVFAEYYWINNWCFKATEAFPTYVYVLKHKRKLYSPFSDKKWISNVQLNQIFGYEQLPETGDLLIIEKSLKDTIYMKLLGFDSIPLNGEAMMMPDKFYEDLKKRFKRIIYHPDNDIPGKKAGESFKQKYGLEYFTNPDSTPKDTTDYWSKYDKEKTINMIKENIWKN